MATFCTSEAFWYDPTPVTWLGGHLTPPPIAPGAAESGWLIVATGTNPCGQYGGSSGQTLLARSTGDGTFAVLSGGAFIEGEGPFPTRSGDLYCYSFGPNYDNTDPPQNLPAPPSLDPMGAGFPELLVQIAFTTPYNDTTPTWVDVTGYVRAFTVQRGRPDAFSLCEPGTLTITLNNTDGRFDPENTSGPYYGYIRPNRRVRVGTTLSGTYRPIFTGFCGAFPQTWPNGSDDCETTVQATDRFKLFARRTDSLNSRPDEAADVRITALLQHAGIGSGDRDINPEALAARTVATHDYDGENLLQTLQDAALADGGMLFMDGYGIIRYQTVKYRQIGGATRARTSQARFGNDATSIPVEISLTRTVDDGLMANKVMATDCNGDLVVAEDTSYQDDDGLLEMDLGGTLLLPTDAQDRVDDLLALRKNPTPRFAGLPLDLLTMSVAEQATILGLDFSDRLTLAVIPPGQTVGAERDQWIESISHTVQVTGSPSWQVGFGLSSAGDAAVAIP